MQIIYAGIIPAYIVEVMLKFGVNPMKNDVTVTSQVKQCDHDRFVKSIVSLHMYSKCLNNIPFNFI